MAITHEHKAYTVNLWGSDPAEENDDCWIGLEFETLAEALEAYNDPWGHMSAKLRLYVPNHTVHTIELDGPDDHRERRNPGFRRLRDDSWQREIATQAGMAFGCNGYNDAMGY